MELTKQEKIENLKKKIRLVECNADDLEVFIKELFNLVGQRMGFSILTEILNCKNDKVLELKVNIKRLKDELKSLKKSHAHISGEDKYGSWDDMAGKELALDPKWIG